MTQVDADPVAVRVHSVGLSALATGRAGPRLQEIAALPESQALAAQIGRRLAHAPGVLFAPAVSSNAVAAGAPLLQPLAEDVLRQESFLELRGPDTRHLDWTLAVALPAERMAVWRTNLPSLLRLWGLGDCTRGQMEGFPAAEVRRATSPRLVRWVEAGPWLVLGVGDGAVPGFVSAVSRCKTGGRPVAALTHAWLEVAGDLHRLAGPLSLVQDRPWPRVELAFSTRPGGDVRTTGRLLFPEPASGPLPAWQVPTNLITEPLLQFAAVRGIAPWLGRFESPRAFRIQPLPDQFYSWAQGDTPYQSFLAFPFPGASNRTPEITSALLARYGPGGSQALPFEFFFDPTNRAFRVVELPWMTPTLQPVRGPDQDYLLASLFPRRPRGAPPPRELLSQLGTTNLVAYHWEISPDRLDQWLASSQLLCLMSGLGQLQTNAAPLPWLYAVSPRLHDCATEITALSPREWRISRRSDLGLTVGEMVMLARWLDNRVFPRFRFAIDDPETRRVPRLNRP